MLHLTRLALSSHSYQCTLMTSLVAIICPTLSQFISLTCEKKNYSFKNSLFFGEEQDYDSLWLQ